jgi:hypothetical protein
MRPSAAAGGAAAASAAALPAASPLLLLLLLLSPYSPAAKTLPSSSISGSRCNSSAAADAIMLFGELSMCFAGSKLVMQGNMATWSQELNIAMLLLLQLFTRHSSPMVV